MRDLKIKYMRSALREAKKGEGKVSPNPLVGAVVVKEGNIIGRGYHKSFGKEHAEINALNSCICDAEGADMYVNLEPCSHHGKNPPCVDRIIKEKIKRVYIGVIDPSPHSNGKGIEILKKAGIEVETGICEEESKLINSVFFYSLKNDTPYIVLKAAISTDGCIATDKGHSKWITCDKSRREVHRLRNLYDAVLVGKNTVLQDDPELTVRSISGRDPVRIIIDERLDLDVDHKVFRNGSKSIIITSSDIQSTKETIYEQKGITVFRTADDNGILNIRSVLKALYKSGIRSIMVEGGGMIFEYMLKNKLANRVNIFIAPKLIGSGKRIFANSGFKTISDCISLNVTEQKFINQDVFIDAFLEYRS